jgi:hypothetical protein
MHLNKIIEVCLTVFYSYFIILVERYVSEENNACNLSVIQYDWDPEEIGTTPVGTSVNIYQSARCNIPEDLHLHQHRSENLKSHNFIHCHLDVSHVTFQHQNNE